MKKYFLKSILQTLVLRTSKTFQSKYKAQSTIQTAHFQHLSLVTYALVDRVVDTSSWGEEPEEQTKNNGEGIRPMSSHGDLANLPMKSTPLIINAF